MTKGVLPNCRVQASRIKWTMRTRGDEDLLAAFDELDPIDRANILDYLIKLCSYVKGLGPTGGLELLAKIGMRFCIIEKEERDE